LVCCSAAKLIFSLVFLGKLHNTYVPKPWGLYDLLTVDYKWDVQLARDFADFLLPMLAYDPNQRATAAECLLHPWLTGQPLSEEEQQRLADKRAGLSQLQQEAGMENLNIEDEADEEVCFI
jgi:serine/threonine protein kinase